MTTTTAVEVQYFDPTTIKPDPDNPRGKLRDLDELAASIRLHGVLEPITVRFADPLRGDLGMMVVRGHRRHAAAIKAKAPTMPCIFEVIEGTDDASEEQLRAVRRIVENLQRDDFTPVEEARAVQQLLDLGLESDAIAANLAVPVDRVQSAVKVSASPIAQAVADKYELSMEQALTLAEFDQDKEIVKTLTVIAKDRPQDWNHSVARFRMARERDQTYEAAKAAFANRGYKVLEDRPNFEDRSLALIDVLQVSEKHSGPVTHKNHAKCPGRAVHMRIDYNGKPTILGEYCIDPLANGHVDQRGEKGSAAAGAKAEPSAKEKLERRTHLACMASSRAATTVRRQFVREVLTRKSPPPFLLTYAITQAVTCRIEDHYLEFCDLTGVEEGTKYGDATKAQAKFLAKVTQGQLPLVLFARIAAHVENAWESNTWATPLTVDRGNQRAEYLDVLLKLGYHPSLVEQLAIGKSKPAAVLAEADAAKAAVRGSKALIVKEVDPATMAGTRARPTKRAVPVKRAVKRQPARRSAS